MEPKKKDNTMRNIICAMSLVFVIWAALLAAVANVESGGEAMQTAILTMEYMSDKPLNISITDYTLQFVGMGVFIWAIVMLALFSNNRNYIHGKEFGTAQWGGPDDIKDLFAENILKEEIAKVKKKKRKLSAKDNAKIEDLKKKYHNADMPLTKTERISIYNYKLNNNTVVIGGSGSGKTRGYIMPNILQAHSSYVVTDPKGEILEKSGHFLADEMGYKIRVLNLDDKASSDGYNPFVYVHPEREGYEERVLTLIETIIVNTDGGEKKGGSDPFWPMAERLFLQAIFFFVADGFEPEEQNMSTVLELIQMLAIGEEEDNYDSDLDYFAKEFEDIVGPDNIGVQQFKEFRSKAAGKTAKSIVISAVARLAPFRVSAVRRIFSYDSMDLDRLGEEPMAIFVVVPPTDPTFNFIAGMLFTQMFQELQYCATQVHKHEGQRLPVPCRFLLDEFANTCVIPNFVKILAYARSFGIGITVVLQSLEQIKSMYKDEWGVILDNCNSLLYLGSISHVDTLEYMSKLLGKGTFDKKSTGRSRGRSGSTSENNDVVGRELMDISEIRKLDKQHCLLVVGGRNPFYSMKYEYKNHPNYKYTSDANAKYSYTYIPQQPPVIEAATESESDVPAEPYVYEEVKPDEINVITDPAQLLEKVTTLFNSLSPEEIEDPDTIMEAVDEILAADEISEADRQAAREYAKKLVQAEKDKITVMTDPQEIINEIESRDMDVASDEEYSEMNDDYYDDFTEDLMADTEFE